MRPGEFIHLPDAHLPDRLAGVLVAVSELVPEPRSGTFALELFLRAAKSKTTSMVINCTSMVIN